jgi:hypothetical protein
VETQPTPAEIDHAATWGLVAGLVVIAIVWLLYVILSIRKKGTATDESGNYRTGDYLMSRFWEGADGRASLSKFQYWLWILVIVFGLVWVWVQRIILSDNVVSPVNDLPENVLGILLLSTGASLGAKNLTTARVRDDSMPKSRLPEMASTRERLSYLLADDDGFPELSKLQMFLFTLVSVVFFVTTLAQSAYNVEGVNELKLPDLDTGLLVLMGISTSGYLGKKFVTREAPVIQSVLPASYAAGSDGQVLLLGSNLGDEDVGVLTIGSDVFSKAQKDSATWPVIEWTNSQIKIDRAKLPSKPELVSVTVTVNGASSKPATLEVSRQT